MTWFGCCTRCQTKQFDWISRVEDHAVLPGTNGFAYCCIVRPYMILTDIMNIDWLWLAYNYVIDLELIDHIAFRGVTLFLFPTHTRCPRWIRCVSNNHTWRRAKRFAKRWRRLVRSLKSIWKSIENSRGSRKNCVCDYVIVQSFSWWLGLDLFERSNKESVTITYLPANDELQYKGVLCLLAYVCVGLRFGQKIGCGHIFCRQVELVTCLPFFTLLQDLDEEPEPVLQKNYTAPKRPLWESRHGMPETLSLERMRRDSWI
jgi:hypothetical protein